MIDAMEITSETMDNIFFREAMLRAREDVSMGQPLSETLERSKSSRRWFTTCSTSARRPAT
jgi:type II secretory pathway component PulF